MDSEIDMAALSDFIEIFVTPAADADRHEFDCAADKFDYYQAAKKYRAQLVELYGKQPMLGKVDDVKITELFTDFYVCDTQPVFTGRWIDSMLERGEIHSSEKLGKRERALPLVMAGNNLYIRGKPGIGKTAFLKYVAMQAVEGDLRRVPIFVSVREWLKRPYNQARKVALRPYLVEQFAICNFPNAELFVERLLESGKVLVLFDGLDEEESVERQQRRRLRELLGNFTTEYSDCQYLLSSSWSYGLSMFEGMRTVALADLLPEQIETYVEKWFTGQPHILAAFNFKGELTKAENAGFADLSRNPLLLTMLCIYFNDAQKFPNQPEDLYEEAIDGPSRKWGSSQSAQHKSLTLSLWHKQRLFAWIAVQTFGKNNGLIDQQWLIVLIEAYLLRLPHVPNDIDELAVLKDIELQHDIFTKQDEGIYSFAHPTVQEYFAALYVVENTENDSIKELVKSHLTDDHWRKVFLLVVNMLGDKNDFFEQMRQQAHAIISDDPVLVDLVSWAERRAEQITAKDEWQNDAIRFAYISLACARSFVLDYESYIYLVKPVLRERAVERTHALALAFDRIRDRKSGVFAGTLSNTLFTAIARALMRVYDLSRDRKQAQDSAYRIAQSFDPNELFSFNSDIVLERWQDFAKNLHEEVAVDFRLIQVWQYASIFGLIWKDNRAQLAEAMNAYEALLFPLTIDFVRTNIDAPELVRGLEMLDTPTALNSPAQWQTFTRSLEELLSTQRMFDFKCQINRKQLEKMNLYFTANERLVRCLTLSVV